MEVLGHEPLEYSLRLRPDGIAYAIREETLSQRRGNHSIPLQHINSREQNIRYYDPEKRKGLPPSWEHTAPETSLANVPQMFQKPKDIHPRLTPCTSHPI